jgi:hypothetical protein
MPKSYSQEYIDALNSVGMHDNLGVTLARACVKANLPLKLVAKILGVSRMTVHTWFRGGPIRPGRTKLVQLLLKTIEVDTARGLLPLADFKEARVYVHELTKDSHDEESA